MKFGLFYELSAAPPKETSREQFKGGPPPMRQLGLVLAIALLAGCAVSPADRDSAREAWEKRDEERARECQQQRGRFISGSCSFGGR